MEAISASVSSTWTCCPSAGRTPLPLLVPDDSRLMFLFAFIYIFIYETIHQLVIYAENLNILKNPISFPEPEVFCVFRL